MQKHHFIISALLIPALLLLPAASACADEIGTLEDTLASDDAEYEECTLGDATADAVCWSCGTDIAIIHGGALGYSLIYGSVEDFDLENSFPDDNAIYIATVTPEQLTSFLEELISPLTSDGGYNLVEEESATELYPQFSGFTLKYDVSCLAGERVEKITLDGDEDQLDLEDDETLITMAVTDVLLETLEETGLESSEPTDETLRTAFAAYLEENGTLSAPDTDRTTVRGLGGKTLISYVPFAAILVAVILIAYFAFSQKERNRKFYTFDPY